MPDTMNGENICNSMWKLLTFAIEREGERLRTILKWCANDDNGDNNSKNADDDDNDNSDDECIINHSIIREQRHIFYVRKNVWNDGINE